jgi:hypothetical protein
MMMWAVLLFLSPLIFLGVLLFGIRSMSTDEIALVKVLLVVLGPFAFDFWWIAIRHLSSRYRAKQLIAEHSESCDDFSEVELRFLEQVGKPRHLQNLGVLILSSVGSVCGAYLSCNSGNMQFFIGVLAGIFGPLILIAVHKMFLRSN